MDSPSPTQSRKRAADGPGRAGGKRLRSDTLGVRLGNLSRSPTAHDHSETLTAGNRADPRIHEDGSIRDVQDSPSDMKDYTVSRHSGDTAHRPKPRCVRISGIPKRWSDTDLIAALQTFDPSLEGRQHDISMYPACCGDTQTALLNSNTCAEIVERRQSKQATHIFNESSGSEIFLAIDSHFNDLTPLNRAESIILADVVAVTGLAGHAFGSWRNRNTYKMWLKDFLPEDVLGFRIMTYGYNSNLVNDTVDDEFLDYRRRFIHTLQNARRGAEKRPIIFVGHSMGGILILQALLQCNNGRQYKHLFAATRAILFFGMPHQGMEVEELRAMVKDVSPLAASRLEIIQQLEEGSNFLNTQKDDITNLWDAASEIEILSFYETKKTVTVGKSATGSWGRSGEKVNMVKKNSAQLFWPWEHRIPVSSDHTEIVKFSHREDTTYQDVVTHMIKWKESIGKKSSRTCS
ncbi:hypothetical protein BDD12DRAFT_428180 [Trichophaea hybrida]|nr:hypothetical protein BDD12DRAFT_428180 [Trichophaea hybrida]